MGSHALLSASSSKRWIECPPSARMCEQYEDKGSNYAAEGTEAHALCEYLLKTALGMQASDPRPALSHYTEEMHECAESYVAYAVIAAGLDPFEHKLLGLTAMEKLLGKKRFGEMLSSYVERPQGKPTLVPESDNRPEINNAKTDFADE